MCKYLGKVLSDTIILGTFIFFYHYFNITEFISYATLGVFLITQTIVYILIGICSYILIRIKLSGIEVNLSEDEEETLKELFGDDWDK